MVGLWILLHVGHAMKSIHHYEAQDEATKMLEIFCANVVEPMPCPLEYERLAYHMANRIRQGCALMAEDSRVESLLQYPNCILWLDIIVALTLATSLKII